mmetsp:Transcript_31466/g.83857  ORF Transcript_31466/g.83857 Transcript_31466/m.83857 type:complete len:239 (+) Transcript_31466:452-1168(+)
MAGVGQVEPGSSAIGANLFLEHTSSPQELVAAVTQLHDGEGDVRRRTTVGASRGPTLACPDNSHAPHLDVRFNRHGKSTRTEDAHGSRVLLVEPPLGEPTAVAATLHMVAELFEPLCHHLLVRCHFIAACLGQEGNHDVAAGLDDRSQEGNVNQRGTGEHLDLQKGAQRHKSSHQQRVHEARVVGKDDPAAGRRFNTKVMFHSDPETQLHSEEEPVVAQYFAKILQASALATTLQENG